MTEETESGRGTGVGIVTSVTENSFWKKREILESMGVKFQMGWGVSREKTVEKV